MKLDDAYLDELQEEAEKLVVLLRDRHPGLASWQGSFRERLTQLKELMIMGRRYDPELIAREEREGWTRIAEEALRGASK